MLCPAYELSEGEYSMANINDTTSNRAPEILTPRLDGKTPEVAKAQKNLLLSVLASIVSNGLFNVAGDTAGAQLIAALVVLAILAFNIWCVYRLCKALDKGPVLWIIAMFIPLINLICLLVLNQQATRHLKDRGIKVGLMGAKNY